MTCWMTDRQKSPYVMVSIARSCMLAVGLSVFLTSYGMGQETSNSASELIRSLSEVNHPVAATSVQSVSCGETDEIRQQRALAAKLGGLGQAAIPAINRALDSIEKEGQRSPLYPVAGWLFLAYAQIDGPNAIPPLTRMMASSKLEPYRITLDRAAALALGLTSYISSFHPQGSVVICRRHEPRDALDELILSLGQDDSSQLESILGSDAGAALHRMLVQESWQEIGGGYWNRSRKTMVAVGYRFDIRGRWSEPEETLRENRDYDGASLTSENVKLYTEFVNRVGSKCGNRNVHFRKLDLRTGVRYEVDDTDLVGLLRSIAACAQ